MSEQDRNKWNQRYADESYRKRDQPGPFIEEWFPQFSGGKALDVACGLGHKALFLAQAGYQVDAIDVSVVGLARAEQSASDLGLKINWIEHDLDQSYIFDSDYDLILVMWYVNLALIRQLCACLAPGGYLLCEEHLITDQEVIGPQDPAFRVAPGALREAARGFEVCSYVESGDLDADGDRVGRARLVVRNR